MEFLDIFFKSDIDVGIIDKVKYCIDLEDIIFFK